MGDSFFVWTKVGIEAGESVTDILARKEAERVAGKGIFWWGVGNSLGPAVHKMAEATGGTLPILFCALLGPSKPHDIAPASIVRWKRWRDWNGKIADVPSFVRVTSRGQDWNGKDKGTHYALVCRSENPIIFDRNGPLFDPRYCTTHLGKIPGDLQITALLRGDLNTPHRDARYRIAFKATLVSPWMATFLGREIVA